MAEPVHMPMTVEDFLVWDDGTDRRYELVDGEVLAVALPSIAHGTIVANIARHIGNRLRQPCRGLVGAGIQPHERDDTFYQADIVVTCAPPAGGQRVPDPVVIVEVLSPSTTERDRGAKVPDYQELPTVQEILLVSSVDYRIQHWRRVGEEWVVKTVHGERIVLSSVGASLTIAEIYAGSGLE